MQKYTTLQLAGANYATASYKGFTQFSETVGGFEVYPSRASNENSRCNPLSRIHMRTRFILR